MNTKTYTTKELAIEAARAALRPLGCKDPMSAVHFQLEQQGDEWAWHQMNLTTGEVAIGELLSDGVTQGPAPKVTICPPAGKAAAPVKAKAPASPKVKGKAEPKKAAPAAIPPGMVKARNLVGKVVFVKADDPLLVGGQLFPNKTRANDARRALTEATAKKTAAKAPKQPNVRQLERVAAERGKLPTAPDFSAPTHKRYLKRLEAIVAMVKAGNVKGLKADDTQPVSSSRVILCRYRDNAIVALEAQRKAGKAPKAQSVTKKAA